MPTESNMLGRVLVLDLVVRSACGVPDELPALLAIALTTGTSAEHALGGQSCTHTTHDQTTPQHSTSHVRLLPPARTGLFRPSTAKVVKHGQNSNRPLCEDSGQKLVGKEWVPLPGGGDFDGSLRCTGPSAVV